MQEIKVHFNNLNILTKKKLSKKIASYSLANNEMSIKNNLGIAIFNF